MSPLPKNSGYAFCMQVDASPLEPFHVRKLGPDGPQFSGGADQPLCGCCDDNWGNGKDLNIAVTGKSLAKACAVCAAIYWNLEGESWVLNSLQRSD